MVLRTAITWTVMIALTAVTAVALTVVGLIAPSAGITEFLIRFWSATGMRLAGVRLEVRGAEHVGRGPYVVVANHISVLDILVHFHGIPVPVRFLAKRELFRIPLLGAALRSIGVVEVDRRGTAAALDRINRQARRVIAKGESLIVYPEGTRSRSGELQRFKLGAFVIAAHTGVPVVPATVYGTREVMKADSMWIRGGPVTLVIDEPIWPEGTDRADIAQLAKRSRAIIEERYDELRGTVPQS